MRETARRDRRPKFFGKSPFPRDQCCVRLTARTTRGRRCRCRPLSTAAWSISCARLPLDFHRCSRHGIHAHHHSRRAAPPHLGPAQRSRRRRRGLPTSRSGRCTCSGRLATRAPRLNAGSERLSGRTQVLKRSTDAWSNSRRSSPQSGRTTCTCPPSRPLASPHAYGFIIPHSYSQPRGPALVRTPEDVRVGGLLDEHRHLLARRETALRQPAIRTRTHARKREGGTEHAGPVRERSAMIARARWTSQREATALII